MTCAVTSAQNIEGVWTGTAKVGAAKEITFNFIIAKEQQAYATIIAIPSQRVSGLRPEQTTFKDNVLFIDGSNLGFQYRGTYDPTIETFTGEFKEGFNTIVLLLKRATTKSEGAESRRPQEPEVPLPYFNEEVVFRNEKAQLNLSGTFTRPHGTRKYPVVLLISGSGPSDRDETFAGHKPFLVLSDYLTKKGIAVLRYDDRGRGASTGDYASATTLDFAKDAASAITYLKTRSDINSKHIGIIGHSEGGIIAPIVANMLEEDVSFIISLAGTAIPGSELSLLQSQSLRPFPVPDEEAYENAIRKVIAIASKPGPRAEIKAELLTQYHAEIAPILNKVTGSQEQTNQIINQFVENRTTPWSRYFYNYNPADEYKKVTCAVLGLYGTKDTQVTAEINAPALEKALKNGRTIDFEVKKLEHLNHLFQECETGAMSEYETIPQTFAPSALQEISNWILKRTTIH